MAHRPGRKAEAVRVVSSCGVARALMTACNDLELLTPRMCLQLSFFGPSRSVCYAIVISHFCGPLSSTLAFPCISPDLQNLRSPK